MNETQKKFSAEILKEIETALSQRKVADLMENTKADVSGETLRFVISTDDEDRQGDVLDQSKWDISKFLLNPVVLWAHDYGSLPIGRGANIVTEGGKSYREIKFTPSHLYPFGAQVGALAMDGWINTVSVGYIEREDGVRELLEVSCCPVPANPFALAQRDIKRLGLDIAELTTKGLTFSIKEKAEQIGDHCELEDGTPGILAEDEDNPGEMVCVPPEGGKGQKTKPNENMKDNELIKALQAEHGRHGKAIAKSIDEFTEKAMPDDEEEKADQPEQDCEKAIAEFGKVMDAEQETHLEKCMKAVDDHAYEIDPEAKKGMKGVDEFKSEMESEHAKHVKSCKKAISEFKKSWDSADGDKEKCEKAIAEFTKSHSDELDRHEKAHMELCEAEMPEADEKTAEKTAAQDPAPQEQTEEPEVEQKSGRAISSANKEKIKAVIKAIQDAHDDHNKSHTESTKHVIDALTELIGNDEDDDAGGEGEEQKPKKAAPAPKKRSGSSGSSASAESFEAYMLAKQILKTVASATEDGLHKVKEIMRDQFPDRR